MKYAIACAVILLSSCKKDEVPERVVVAIWGDTCSIDYYNGSTYAHDTIGTLNDTIGPVIDNVTLDTIGWNVNVTPKHYFEYSYEGRRIYVRTRGIPGYYSHIHVYYGDGNRAFKTSLNNDTEAVIDISY